MLTYHDLLAFVWLEWNETSYLPYFLALPLSLLAVFWLYHNYLAYLSLGPGGLPHNAHGWFWALAFKPLGREVLSTAVYEREGEEQRSWLGGGEEKLERRSGGRPKISWHFIPHRQVEAVPDEGVTRLLESAFYTLAERNPHLVQLATSPHEKLHEGLVIHPRVATPHGTAEKALREIAHLHVGSDWSLHVVLAPRDCKTVIESEWGQRHPISGFISLPKEYLMVYAPRNEEEVKIVERIIKAAVGFMTNTSIEDVR